MAKNKSLKKRSQKTSSKSTAPRSETHAARSRNRVMKKSASSPSTPRLRSGVAAVSTRNTSRATKHKVTIDIPDESVNETAKGPSSSSEEADNISTNEAPEVAAVLAEAAKLARKMSEMRRMSANKRLPALEEELKCLRMVEKFGTSMADLGQSGQSVD